MTSKRLFASLFIVLLAVCADGQDSPKPVDTFGDVTVAKVNRLDEHVRIYCEIPELPPIIGRDIPVCIHGLTPSANPQDNLKLLMFLNDLFLSKNAQPEKILLKDIRRGDTFCLVADIEVDGKDVCELLIENKLAEKVIQVPVAASEGTPAQAVPATASKPSETPPADLDKAQFVASKSSKVYHWSTCPHVKRMDMSKAIIFSSRTEAEATGRRPCKTCKP